MCLDCEHCACVHEERSGYCWCSVQPCLTLRDPMDCSSPGSSVHGILWARILGWVAMPSSRGSSQIWDRTRVSCVSCFGRRVLFHWATREALNSGRIPFWFSDKSYIQTLSATASLFQTTEKMACSICGFKAKPQLSNWLCCARSNMEKGEQNLLAGRAVSTTSCLQSPPFPYERKECWRWNSKEARIEN